MKSKKPKKSTKSTKPTPKKVKDDPYTNVPRKKRRLERRYEETFIRQKTVYDDVREGLGVDRLAIDSSNYEPLDPSFNEKKTVRRIGARNINSDEKFETRHGFEVCRNRDPSEMLFLTPCADGHAPRGWSRKYWWDLEKPIQWIESGGRITRYSKKHQEVLDQVNSVLRLAMKDEGRITKERIADQESPLERLQLDFKHQIVRDVGAFPLGQPYLFSNDDPKHPPTEYSDPVIPPNPSLTCNHPIASINNDAQITTLQNRNSRRQAVARLLPSSARCRLYDSQLLDELERQQQLRQSCSSVQNDINDCLKHLEEVEGIWIQRTDGTPLSHAG